VVLDAVAVGMQAALTRSRVSALNIANAHSEGYRAYRVVQFAGPPGSGPETRVERTDAPTDLVDETVSQITVKHEMALYAGVMRRQDQMVGSLLDLLA
jgi:flagellar basal body rod protein FlgG